MHCTRTLLCRQSWRDTVVLLQYRHVTRLCKTSLTHCYRHYSGGGCDKEQVVLHRLLAMLKDICQCKLHTRRGHITHFCFTTKAAVLVQHVCAKIHHSTCIVKTAGVRNNQDKLCQMVQRRSECKKSMPIQGTYRYLHKCGNTQAHNTPKAKPIGKWSTSRSLTCVQ